MAEMIRGALAERDREYIAALWPGPGSPSSTIPDDPAVSVEVAFQEVRRLEREACAEVAAGYAEKESEDFHTVGSRVLHCSKTIADRIRARGKVE